VKRDKEERQQREKERAGERKGREEGWSALCRPGVAGDAPTEK